MIISFISFISLKLRRSSVKTLININGKIYRDQKQAKISIFDRGFLYGDSVYEVTETLHYFPIKLAQHLDRLYESAFKIGLKISVTKEFITEKIYELIKELNISKTYIRMIVTRGEGEIGLDPHLAFQQNLVLIIKELPPNPEWWYEEGVPMIISKTIRNSIMAIDPSIKSGNYLNNVLAIQEAKELKAFDAIMLNQEGYVTEGTSSNIWMITEDDRIWTPALEAGILKGITRETLIHLMHDHDFKIEEKLFIPQDLKNAKECFLTSSTRHIVPIIKIDDKVIGNGRPGIVTNRLIKIYREDLLHEVKKALS